MRHHITVVGDPKVSRDATIPRREIGVAHPGLAKGVHEFRTDPEVGEEISGRMDRQSTSQRVAVYSQTRASIGGQGSTNIVSYTGDDVQICSIKSQVHQATLAKGIISSDSVNVVDPVLNVRRATECQDDPVGSGIKPSKTLTSSRGPDSNISQS